MANNYMDILYVPDYSPDAPLVMTPEIARALIIAHDEGRGMSDELLARARVYSGEPIYQFFMGDIYKETWMQDDDPTNKGALTEDTSDGWKFVGCGGSSEYPDMTKLVFSRPILAIDYTQWRSDISWIWMRELARGNIATTPIKGADLQVGQVVAGSDHTLYRLIAPLKYGELGWSGKVYRQWRVESVNVPRSSVSVQPFFVAQEYRLSEE